MSDGGFLLGGDAFSFGGVVTTEAPAMPALPCRAVLRRAIYAGGMLAATGRLTLEGYDAMDARATARLDVMVDGVLRQLAAEAG